MTYPCISKHNATLQKNMKLSFSRINVASFGPVTFNIQKLGKTKFEFRLRSKADPNRHSKLTHTKRPLQNKVAHLNLVLCDWTPIWRIGNFVYQSIDMKDL